jgi:hypothetical protein
MSFRASGSQDENPCPYSPAAPNNWPPALRSHPQPPWNASTPATPSFPPVLAPPYYPYLQTPTQSWDPPIPGPNPGQFSFQAYNPTSIPLADATTAINIVPTSARGRKRGTASTARSCAPAKRRRIDNSHELDVAPSCGVGPAGPSHDIASSTSETIQLSVTQPPLESYKGYPVPKNGPANAATDVWYFMRPLDSKDKPAQWPLLDAGGEPVQEVVLERKPKSKYVGCKLCS